MAKIDLRHARPTVEKLPDGRQRATFAYTVREWVGRTQAEITAEIWAAWGTVAPGDFTALRLVKQNLQGLEPDKTGGLPLLRVFEEIPESAEVQVGKDTISYGEDGGKTIVAEFLQFSSATYTPGTIGTTTAPGDATLYLQTEDAQDDGTLRRIKRTYVDAGTLSTAEETRNNGALSLITITSVKTEPATPSGYTLVSTSVKNADGVPVYTYSFAKGNGLVDYTVAFSDFTTAGANGITRLTLRYLASPSSSVTPSSQSGYVQISSAFAEADGHRVWTTVWAKGAGTISTNDDTRNNGALLLRTIKSLGTAPSTPSGYASTPVSADVSNQDGFQVYTYTFAKGVGEISRESRTGNNGALLRLSIGYLTAPAAAEPTPTSISGYTKINVGKREADGHLVWSLDYVQGVGEISRDIDYSQSSDEGVTGLTRTTIRYLVAPAGTIQPTTLSGSVLVGQSVSEADGHRVWTTQWAKGTGTVVSANSTREGGNLIIYRRTALGSAPSAPAATRGGAVAIVDALSRVENGVTVYDYTWAEGNGEVSRQTSIDKLGNLLTYTIRHLTAFAVTSNPTTVSGATVISTAISDQDGYRLWTVVWRKTISSTAQTTVQAQTDGSIIYTVTDYTDSSATPADPTGGSAYLVKLTEEMNDGFIVTTAVYHKPPADYDFPKTVSFTMPGFATAGNPPVLEPPVTKKLKATFYVSYSLSQNSDTPYTVNEYAQLIESYLPTGSFLYQGNVRSLDGYLGSSTDSQTANVTYRGISVSQWANTVVASDPTARPSGDTVIDTDCEIYLTTTAGVKLYRNVSVKYSF